MDTRLKRGTLNIQVNRGVHLTRSQELRLFKGHEPVVERRKSRLKERLTDRERDMAEVLILANEGMAHQEAILMANICRSYYRIYGHVDTRDFVQEAYLGQISAMEKFDQRLGYRFTTYGKRWIRSFLKTYASRIQAREKTNTKDITRITRINWFVSDFQAEHKRKPTTREIAEGTGIKDEKVTLLLDFWRGIEDTTDKKKEEVFDRLAKVADERSRNPEVVASKEQVRQMLDMMLDRLSPREKEIIKRRVGWGSYRREESLEEIGDSHELTRERIRQIEAKAMDKLRRMAGKMLDRSVLGLYEQ